MNVLLCGRSVFNSVVSPETAANLPIDFDILGEALSCTIAKADIGEDVLELSYPADGLSAQDLWPGVILCAETGSGAEFRQYYRIVEVRRTFRTVEVIAEHISYWLNNFLVPPMRFSPAESVSTDTIIAHIRANVILPRGITALPFLIHNDISARKYADELEGFTEPFTVRSGLQMIHEQFGLPVIYDNFHVFIQNVDGETEIRYGKNLTEFQQEISESDIVTGCVAYYQNEGVFTKSADVHYTSLSCDELDYDRVVWADCSSQFQDTPDLGVLSDAAEAYLRQHEKVTLDKNLTVNVAPDEDGKKLRLYNNVRVVYPEWGISESAVIVRTEYDVLKERFLSYELGKRTLDITDAIKVINRELRKI